MFDAIVQSAAAQSPLWLEAVRPLGEQERVPVFSVLAPAPYSVGLETIYEGYLVHYGHSRLFAPADRDTALLLGDYLYAHGLVRVAESGDVKAVADLAELISLCARLQADGLEGDGDAWVATSTALGSDATDSADEQVAAALAVHARLVG